MSDERKVLVTTVHRGVFFGTLVEEDEKKVVLKDARNCVYWSADVKGFLGLVASGPTVSCRIGPAALKLSLHDVTAIADCSPEAVEAWERAPWS